MANKRLSGEDYDQKLFRSLARIGSSLRLPSRGGGINVPNIGGKPNKPGRGRASRADWPSEAEIADMVDRNGNGFVGDGEPWMQRVRRSARSVLRPKPAGSNPQSSRINPSREARRMNFSLRNIPGDGDRRRRRPEVKPRTRTKTGNFISVGKPSGPISPRSPLGQILYQDDNPEFAKNLTFVEKKLRPLFFSEDGDLLSLDELTISGLRQQVERGKNSDEAKLAASTFLNEVIANRGEAAEIDDKFFEILRNENPESFEAIQSALEEIRQHKPNSDSDYALELQERLFASMLTKNPDLRPLVEMFGLPKTYLFLGAPKEKESDAPYDASSLLKQAMFDWDTGSVGINETALRFLYGDDVAPFELGVTEKEYEELKQALTASADGEDLMSVANNAEGILLHEYAHYLDMMTTTLGTAEQRQAKADLKSFYELMAELYNDEASQDFINFVDLDAMSDEEFDDWGDRLVDLNKKYPLVAGEPTLQMMIRMPYGMQNFEEFFAEIVTAWFSPDEEVRKLIPNGIAGTLEAIFGFSPKGN
jgi:hypothetical protein